MSRSLASVLAPWLAVCLVEPVQLHTCAMHSAFAIEQTGDAGAHGHSSMPEHRAPKTGAGLFHQEQNSDSESRRCTCLGDCSAGSSQVGFAAAGTSLLTVAIIESSATEVAYVSPRIVAPRFLLPFSNGPPAGFSRA